MDADTPEDDAALNLTDEQKAKIKAIRDDAQQQIQAMRKDSSLSDDAKQQLDALAGNITSAKRYFIAIQGFTDKTGPAEYNLQLSRRRAEAVQTYLIGTKNVPVYRIQLVGLGKDKPLNDQKTKDDREKNRRVEVTVFSADTSGAAAATSGAASQ